MKPQTYSVVVNEVPVKELLNALARDTRQNIDIHPAVSGLVSLNAIDETLPAILERISRQVNIRFRQEGNTIIVSPDTPYVKTYRVNYVNVTRNISSTVNVTGEVGSVGSSGSGGMRRWSGAARRRLGHAADRDDRDEHHQQRFLGAVARQLRAILNSTGQHRRQRGREARVGEDSTAHGMRRSNAPEAVRGPVRGRRAPRRRFRPAQTRRRRSSRRATLADDVIVNPISGTISDHATDKQHQLVQEHLDNVGTRCERQVLIEATSSKSGSPTPTRPASTGGRSRRAADSPSHRFLRRTIAAAAARRGCQCTGGPHNRALSRDGSSSNITAIKLLEQFGNTRVLSSPKLMAINNQTALLKVVDNLVYFEVQAQRGSRRERCRRPTDLYHDRQDRLRTAS